MLLYDCLRMVSFRVKVWVTYIVFLSNGIFRSKSRGRLLEHRVPFILLFVVHVQVSYKAEVSCLIFW